MATADDAVIQSAYEKLAGDDVPTPNYLIAILVSAIPTFSGDTPMLSRSEWNDDGETVTWRIVAADGQRLIRIEAAGAPAEYGRRYDTPLQAATQSVTITPLAGSVMKAEAIVKDTSGWRDRGVQWQTTWIMHFADGTLLTVPSEREAKLHDYYQERIEKFVHDFLALALPR